MNFTVNMRKFRDALKLRYGWEFNDIPTVCVCGDLFDVDYAMSCMRGGLLYSGTTKFEMKRLKFCKRCVLQLQLSTFIYKTNDNI